jgi:hypothetical protein
MGTIATATFAIAFIPLAVITAKKIYRRSNPSTDSPFVLFLGGMFLFAIGAVVAYSQLAWLDSGILDFKFRRSGHIYADSSVEPIEFWFVILVFYAGAVLTSSVGLVGIRHCFNRSY